MVLKASHPKRIAMTALLGELEMERDWVLVTNVTSVKKEGLTMVRVRKTVQKVLIRMKKVKSVVNRAPRVNSATLPASPHPTVQAIALQDGTVMRGQHYAQCVRMASTTRKWVTTTARRARVKRLLRKTGVTNVFVLPITT